MPTTTQDSEGVATLEGLLDNVIKFANEKVDHNTEEFMSKLHRRIIKAMRNDAADSKPTDKVLHAYFQIYALLRHETVSRTRIISTAEAVVHWLR